jgi:hypothetical protein
VLYLLFTLRSTFIGIITVQTVRPMIWEWCLHT